MTVYLIDFETRSLADIKLGGRVYWRDPTTDPVCMAWSTADGEHTGVWLPGDPCPIPAGATVVAWNLMGFDRFGFDRLGWGPFGLIDLMQEAYKAGLPGKLDQFSEFVFGTRKDNDGSDVTKSLSLKPVKNTIDPDVAAALRAYARECKAAAAWVPVSPIVLDRVVAYCRQDVALMVPAYEELESWFSVDAAYQAAQRATNDRGVPFDVALARRLIEEDARNSALAIEREAAGLGIEPAELRTIAGSPAQFTAATGAPNAQAQTRRDMIAQGGRPAAFARARESLATIARGKLEAGLRREIDGRLYDVTKYFGGHTGRESGQGMQLQNLPRPPKELESLGAAEIEALADRVLAGGHVTDGEIALLVRSTLCAPEGERLVVCDFAGVENRALAFYAGDYDELKRLEDPKYDAYKTLAAERIYRVPYANVTKAQRGAGKVGVLACGYQGGPNAIERFAAKEGIDLEVAGVTPQEVVSAWRAAHPAVVKFWYDVERAFAGAVRGRASRVSAFDFVPADDGSAVAIILPSGRPIVYARAGSDRVRRTSRAGRSYMADELYYWGRDDSQNASRIGGFKRISTYGGKLTENIIQAVCRELMAEALVRVERAPAWLRPIMTVHDEIVCLAPEKKAKEGLALLERTMVQLPEWAEGFPIGADGYVSRRYKK